MSYEELIDAIEKDAVKERQKLIDDAGIEAKGVVERAKNDLKSLKEKKIAEFEGYLNGEKALAISQAKREADILLISAKSEILSELFQKAEKRIIEIKNRENYKDTLIKLLRESIERWREEIRTDDFIIYVCEDDMPLLKNFSSDVEIKTDRDMKEGVILVSRDNKFRLINTLKSRMERARTDLLPLLNKVLFENNKSK
jgi:vacuolar-type H+-ATPase subunit E/Vma4